MGVTLVLMNLVITIFAYDPMIVLMSRVFGICDVEDLDMWHVGFNLAVYLGIPLSVGFSMWLFGSVFCSDFYWSKFLPRFASVGAVSLLVVCFLIFFQLSSLVVSLGAENFQVLLLAVPLILYALIMFFASWFVGKLCVGLDYGQTATFALMAASNNFQLALVACIATFGVESPQTAAAVAAHLVEVPIMLLMVTATMACPKDGEESRGGVTSDGVTSDDVTSDDGEESSG